MSSIDDLLYAPIRTPEPLPSSVCAGPQTLRRGDLIGLRNAAGSVLYCEVKAVSTHFVKCEVINGRWYFTMDRHTGQGMGHAEGAVLFFTVDITPDICYDYNAEIEYMKAKAGV